MRATRDLPIHQKMILIILIASAVALVITAAAVVIYESSTFRPRMRDHALVQAELTSLNLHAPLNFNVAEDAQETLNVLRKQPEVNAACVYRRDAAEFARYRRDPVPGFTCPPVPETLAAGFRDGHLDLFHEISFEDEVAGFLFLRYDLPPLWARLPQYWLMVGAVLLALAAVSTLLSLALERHISRPLLALAHVARQVRDREDYTVRAATRGNDEIGTLTEAVNQMLATIEQRDAALRRANEAQQSLQEQLVQAQKMESIGRLAGGVAHDFNNLLTVIVGCTDLSLERLPDDSPLRRLLGNIRQATTQATHLTNQLLAFARRQIIEPKVIDLNTLVLDAEKMLRSLIGEGVELAAIPQVGLWPVKADPGQMMQVLVNLSVNAKDAMPDGGKLTIATQNVDLAAADLREHPDVEPGDFVMVEVKDTGVGLSEEAKAHLFEPFFTTKERGKGTGLGLAMCYGIVKQSGGHLDVTSQAGKGTSFRFFLRRATEKLTAEPTAALPLDLPAGEETMLVVEDNALVRSTSVELLRAQGYTVLDAASGPDALRLVDAYDGEIDLLLTDVVMPEMSGRQVAHRLKAMRPEIRVLYVSGYTPDEIVQHGVLEPGISFLQKPYASAALIRKVREVLDDVKLEPARPR